MRDTVITETENKPTFADAQKYLQNFFKTADPAETIKLWAVLSALRGPDAFVGMSKDVVKDATTAVIRQAFLGERTYDVLVVFAPDSEKRAAVRRNLSRLSNAHFMFHFEEAFKALKLKKAEVNK